MMLVELADEIKNYAKNFSKLEITNFTKVGSVINAEEESAFQIRITNWGPLDMNNVQIELRGRRSNPGVVLSRTDSDGNVIQSGRTIMTGQFDVPANSTEDGDLYFKMSASSANRKVDELFRASIVHWDAGFVSMLNENAVRSGVGATFRAEVHPT